MTAASPICSYQPQYNKRVVLTTAGRGYGYEWESSRFAQVKQAGKVGTMHAGRERPDHYAVLGVPPSASDRQITAAYRRLVRSLHPDARPADPAAADELADVLAAYATLRDAGRRAAYDAARNRQVGPRPARHGTSGSLRDPDVFLDVASWREGPDVIHLTLRLDASGFIGRILRQWMRETDSWF